MSKSARDELKGFFHSENNSSDLISLCFSQICLLFSAIVYMSRDYSLITVRLLSHSYPFEAFFQLLHFLDGEIYSRSHTTFTFAIKKNHVYIKSNTVKEQLDSPNFVSVVSGPFCTE